MGSNSGFFGFCFRPEHNAIEAPPSRPTMHDRVHARTRNTVRSQPQAYNTAHNATSDEMYVHLISLPGKEHKISVFLGLPRHIAKREQLATIFVMHF